MTADRVAVVVLSWNRAEDTLLCLRSLGRADLGGARVIVVDNGSRDGSVEAIHREFPGQRVLALAENRGYAGGNNAGIRVALDEGAEAVLLLNNDTTVAPDFLAPLLQVLEDSPEAAAVSSAVMRMDLPELLDVAYIRVHLDAYPVVRLQGVNALPSEGFTGRCMVEVGTGCSLLVRGEALRRVGLLDEDFFAYHEEVDWCIRARRMGYTILWEPLSRVFHRGSGSTQDLRRRPELAQAPTGGTLPNAEEWDLPWNPVRTYLGARNTVRLVRKHASRREALHFSLSTVAMIPLSLSAILMHREGWFVLQRWSYRDFADAYFVRRHALGRWLAGGGFKRVVATLALVPLWLVDGLWRLPRDLWRAHRDGRTGEMEELIRGLVDGVLGRRIPLKRLRLR